MNFLKFQIMGVVKSVVKGTAKVTGGVVGSIVKPIAHDIAFDAAFSLDRKVLNKTGISVGGIVCETGVLIATAALSPFQKETALPKYNAVEFGKEIEDNPSFLRKVVEKVHGKDYSMTIDYEGLTRTKTVVKGNKTIITKSNMFIPIKGGIPYSRKTIKTPVPKTGFEAKTDDVTSPIPIQYTITKHSFNDKNVSRSKQPGIEITKQTKNVPLEKPIGDKIQNDIRKQLEKTGNSNLNIGSKNVQGSPSYIKTGISSPSFARRPSISVSVNPKLANVGEYGEIKVERRLRLFINKEDVVQKNLLIPHNGADTEIDMIVISRKGILCIEAKFWGGYISGGDVGDWTQTTYYDDYKKQRKLHNPVIQNKGHVEAIKQIFGEDYPIYNVVFLVGHVKCAVKSGYVFDVKKFAEFYKGLDEVIPGDEVAYITSVLKQYKASKEELEAHADKLNKF